MTWTPALIRKVVYLCLICVLLIPLFIIGRPATSKSSGGTLATMRLKNNLSQASLGDIDPASETMKLATLGMRGVATNILWHRAIEYKKKRDFDNLSATLNQISKLQPNFIEVWKYQGHNLSYNISTEFDDYKHRYIWVKKGIRFMTEGTRYNRHNIALLNEIAMFVGQKIGRSDERVQFRRLYREDVDFHNDMKPFLSPEIYEDDIANEIDDYYTDNWRTAKLWNLKGEYEVANNDATITGKSALLFYNQAPMSQINYSRALFDELDAGEVTVAAWDTAVEDLQEFGNRTLPTTWGVTIELNRREELAEYVQQLEKQLDELVPGVREILIEEAKAGLSDEVKEALATPALERTDEQWNAYYLAQDIDNVPAKEIASRAPKSKAAEATRIADKIGEIGTEMYRIKSYRSQVNFDYWRTRAIAESNPKTLRARQLMYDAKRAFAKGDTDSAKELFEQSWIQWDEVLNEYPDLLDGETPVELTDEIKVYQRNLDTMDIEFPEPFILQDVMDIEFKDASVMSAQRRRKSIQEAKNAGGENPSPETKEPETKEPETGDSTPSEGVPANDFSKDEPPSP